MSETPHSPWTYVYEGSGSHTIYDAQERVVARVEECEGFNRDEAAVNARLIERACNSHDELVAACEATRLYFDAIGRAWATNDGVIVSKDGEVVTEADGLDELCNSACEKIHAIISKITESQCP